MALQAEELVAQRKLENDDSQRLATIKDELEREIRRLCRTIDTLHLVRAAEVGPAERVPPGAPAGRGSVQDHRRVLVIAQ